MSVPLGCSARALPSALFFFVFKALSCYQTTLW